VLTEGDVEIIKQCVVAAFSSKATVEADGANILLPHSVGA